MCQLNAISKCLINLVTAFCFTSKLRGGCLWHKTHNGRFCSFINRPDMTFTVDWALKTNYLSSSSIISSSIFKRQIFTVTCMWGWGVGGGLINLSFVSKKQKQNKNPSKMITPWTAVPAFRCKICWTRWKSLATRATQCLTKVMPPALCHRPPSSASWWRQGSRRWSRSSSPTTRPASATSEEGEQALGSTGIGHSQGEPVAALIGSTILEKELRKRTRQ